MKKNNREYFIENLIENCIIFIGFVVLAIVFKHWWIVFFSLLYRGVIEVVENGDE